MRYEDLRIGMKVKANKASNDKYMFTTEENNCIGEVVDFIPETKEFELLLTNCDGFDSMVGDTFEVEPPYFDAVEATKNTEEQTEEELKQNFILSCIEGTTGFEAFKFDDISHLDKMISSLEETREEKKEEIAELVIKSAIEFSEIEFARRKQSDNDSLRAEALLTQLQLTNAKAIVADIEIQIKNLKKLKEIVTE